MAQVRRFILTHAASAGEDVFVAGVGMFTHGVLDIPVANTATITAVQAAVAAMRGVDAGVVDTAVSPGPAQVNGNPFPQYMQPSDVAAAAADPASPLGSALKAAYVAAVTPEGYGAKGDGSTDDTAALQAAINAAVSSGRPLVLAPSAYRTTATLNITGNISIRGSGAAGTSSSVNAGLVADNAVPLVAPYLTGSVILVDAAATDAISINTAIAPTVNLRDFGIRFSDANKFTNTGHGITMAPPAAGAFPDAGVFNSEWSSLKVYGHDGNHYAFNIVNSMYSTMTNLRGFGGGLIRFYQNSGNCNYGNTVFTHPYGVLMCNGTAHGISLETNPTYSGNLLNLITLIRPQIWVQNTTAVTGVPAPTATTQFNLNADGGSARVKNCTIIHADFERSDTSGSPIWPWNLSNIVGGGIQPFNAINTVQLSPTTGGIYQNTSGSAVLYKTAWDLTALAGSAASILCEVSSSSAMTGAAQAAEVSIPAATAGTWRQTCTFMIPAGFYFRLTVANGTRAWARFDRISAV